MFLYYFDNELADSPRGTIDLELYTEVYREDGMLRLGTTDEEILRYVRNITSSLSRSILIPSLGHSISMMRIKIISMTGVQV
jgi:hypothetical protein